MRHVRLVVLMLVGSSFLPLALATAQDDAGSGQDAGQFAPDALLLGAGEYAGALLPSEGDTDDWYRIDVPAGKVLRLWAIAAGPAIDVHIHDGGVLVGSGWIAPWNEWNWAAATTGGEMHLLFRDEFGDGPSAYSFAVEISDAADVYVEDLAVTAKGTRVEGGEDLPVTTQRRVDMLIGNEGAGDASAAVVQAWITHLGSRRDLYSEVHRLSAGETRPVSFDWDGLGEVGEGDLHVSILQDLDSDPSDNAVSREVHVLVENAGVGADPLNVRTTNGGTTYNGHEAGATATARVALVTTYVELSVERQDGTVTHKVCVVSGCQVQ